MKSVSFLAVLSILALTLSSPIASDPDPLQDFCVSTNVSINGAFVNGKFCKDPSLVTADDFYFTGLQNPKRTTAPFGSAVTPAIIEEFPGLNTLGLAAARVDYAIDGLIPPHSHPRASELLFVAQGTLLVGFITSNPDNRLFTKKVEPGELFVFPQGLIHFQVNIGKTTAVSFAALNSQNPGIYFIPNTVFGSNPQIDPNILAKAFQLDLKIVIDLQTTFKKEVTDMHMSV